jgi:hypothetical protein
MVNRIPGFATLRRKGGYLLLYGQTTPPPSITMLNGRVQVWIREDQDEAFRIFDIIRNALHRD